MTRKEAIHILIDLINPNDGSEEAVEMAIKALEQEPITIVRTHFEELPTCEDTISRGVFEQVMWERDVAIEQLKELGYELGQKIEPCDAISREDATKHIKDRLYETACNNTTYQCYADEVFADIAEHRIETWINEMPTVTPSRPKGHWIDREEYDVDRWKCSECGRTEQWQEKFCPNCGAEMVEPQESEG